MELHDLSGGSGVRERIQQVAERSLSQYDFSADAVVSVLNVSENATYGSTIHRPGAERRFACTDSATTATRP